MWGQNGLSEGAEVCGTPDMELADMEQFESWLRVKMEEQAIQDAQRGSATVLTIPVVVHVIHDGTAVGVGNNVSAALVQSQIDVLNEDFRKLAGTPGGSAHPAAVDAEIEFCLAYLAPDGSALTERGIDRINVNELGFTPSPYDQSYINGVIRPATIWDPTQYMNMWVLGGISTPSAGGGTIAGFANFPASVTGVPGLPSGVSSTTDGFVVGRAFFGRPSNQNGRTATHEIGHWLGLHHISNQGNGSGTCQVDDFCTDTPNSATNNPSCAGSNTCGDVEYVNLHMYGTLASCRDMFTQCQADRMRAVLQNSPQRVELLSSTVCDVPTAAPVAAFSISDTATCDGTVQFFDESSPIATSWFWVFSDGQISTDRNPIVTFSSSGTYTATFTANNLNGTNQATQSFNIVVTGVSNSSAGPDINACSGQTVQINGTTDQPNASISWSPATGLSNPNIINPTLTTNGSQIYYLTVVSGNGCAVTDTLNVSVSPNPTTLALPIGGATISAGDSVQLNAVGAIAYVWTPATGLSNPNIANPWAQPAVTTAYTVTGFNAAGCSSTDVVLVTVPGTTGIQANDLGDAGAIFPVYPNPAGKSVVFSGEFSQTGLLSIRLLDISGRHISEIYSGQAKEGAFEFSWNREAHIPAGIYLAAWTLDGRRFIQKIQLF